MFFLLESTRSKHFRDVSSRGGQAGPGPDAFNKVALKSKGPEHFRDVSDRVGQGGPGSDAFKKVA